jgi:hypothetical protein
MVNFRSFQLAISHEVVQPPTYRGRQGLNLSLPTVGAVHLDAAHDASDEAVDVADLGEVGLCETVHDAGSFIVTKRLDVGHDNLVQVAAADGAAGEEAVEAVVPRGGTSSGGAAAAAAARAVAGPARTAAGAGA